MPFMQDVLIAMAQMLALALTLGAALTWLTYPE